MGSLVDFRSASRARQQDAAPASSYGLVTELVDREEPARRGRREGVITLGGLSSFACVEQSRRSAT